MPVQLAQHVVPALYSGSPLHAEDPSSHKLSFPYLPGIMGARCLPEGRTS